MSKTIGQKLGYCIICGSKVLNAEKYLKTTDGYCHRNCLNETPVIA